MLVREQPDRTDALGDSLRVRAGQHSIAGRKPENQDSLGIVHPEGEALRIKGVAAVVADGVSASLAGREAAEACVRGFLSDYYSTPDSWTVETSASRVLGALNRWLHGRGHRNHGDAAAMVCTLTAVILKNNRAYVFHVGDSRAWLLRNGELESLTRDHHAVLGGDRFALARAMGVELNVEIDVHRVILEPGDRFILTTDGVHGYLKAREMARLATDAPPEEAAAALVTAAYQEGSPDNLSAQVLAVEHLPSQDPEAHYDRLTALPFPPLLSPGQVLDGYRIEREIHASTRTQVYLAHPEEGGEPVVLKAPSPNYVDDAGYIDRFLNEIWVTRRVNSPNVVRALAPPDNRQCLYALTEYVPGQTLRQWMDDHPDPALADVRTLMRQIAQGVRALHRLEMVHQDLKPENIMVDSRGNVKIIDLGSVRIRGIEQIDVPWGTAPWAGTASYAAPECLDGEPATPASDRYSLGVIAYEMVTGQLPYGAEPRAGVRRRLSYRSARERNPAVPAWLDACLQKAVAMRPADRYPALSEFLQDLEHPNPSLEPSGYRPLMERVPARNWQFIAVLSLLFNLTLVLILITRGG